MLPRLVDAGDPRGAGCAIADLGLPVGIDVIAGGGDTQMAATGAGGLADGVVSVVAGTTTPLQASTAEFPRDPEQHPWVSAHLRPDRWAAETNAGYTGMSLDWLARISGTGVSTLADEAAASPAGASGITAAVTARIWSEEAWSSGAPGALIGFEPGHARADVARAFIEAHAYGIRGNLEDLERATGKAWRTGSACSVAPLAHAPSPSSWPTPLADPSAVWPATTRPAAPSPGWRRPPVLPASSEPPAFIGETVEPSPQRAHSRRATCDTSRPATPCARRSQGGRHEGAGHGRVPQATGSMSWPHSATSPCTPAGASPAKP